MLVPVPLSSQEKPAWSLELWVIVLDPRSSGPVETLIWGSRYLGAGGGDRLGTLEEDGCALSGSAAQRGVRWTYPGLVGVTDTGGSNVHAPIQPLRTSRGTTWMDL
jgi:hypothetical protein